MQASGEAAVILYGRDLSPYARRVAIWARLQGRALERRALAATDPRDAEAIRAVHPGLRVPVLELEDGTRLIESFAICDWLDETVPEGRRLVPASGPARRDGLQRIALAHATTEKIVALVYERNRRPETLHWPEWQERLAGQVRGGFAALEAAAPAVVSSAARRPTAPTSPRSARSRWPRRPTRGSSSPALRGSRRSPSGRWRCRPSPRPTPAPDGTRAGLDSGLATA